MESENKMSQKNEDKKLIYMDNKLSEIFEPKTDKEFEDFFNNRINIDGVVSEKKEKEFYKEQFYVYIKNKVNNFMYGQKDNIIFLLGAGASVLGNQWKYGKTMSRLSCEIINKLYHIGEKVEPKSNQILPFATFAKLSNISNESELQDVVKKVLNNKADDNTPKFELENFISTLNKISNLAHDHTEIFNLDENQNFINQVENTKNLIQQEISKLVQYKDYPFNDNHDSFQHLAIMKVLMNMLDKDDSKLEMVTTNYDTVIEKAAEKGKITVFDGFGFSSHATFDDRWFDWNLSKRLKNLDTAEVEYNPNVIDLLKIHGSVDWIRKDGEIVKHGELSDISNTEEQVMIFPSSDKYKQSYDKPYFELMSRFQSLLRKPNTLLITSGFSFSDEHITRMIMDAIKINSGLRTLITDYSFDNSSYNKMKALISNNYDIALLRASMNDRDFKHGLHFYLI